MKAPLHPARGFAARHPLPQGERAEERFAWLTARARLSRPHRQEPRRRGGAFLLANGRGGMVDPASALAREPFLAVAELTGAAGASRIILAAPIALAEIEARFGEKIEEREAVTFDPASVSLRARRSRRLGALALAEQTKPVAPNSDNAKLLAEGIAAFGIGKLPWSKAQLQLRNRVLFLRRAEGEEWPDLSDAALARMAAEWLAPYLADKTSLTQISADELSAALDALLPWAFAQAARRRGADPFHRAVRFARADRLRGGGGPETVRSGCKSCSGLPSIRASPAGGWRW